MKKELLSGIAAALVAGLILLLVLLPTGETPPDTQPPTTTGTVGTTTATTPTKPTRPVTPPTTSVVVTPTGTTVVTSPPPETTVPEAPGVVRLYTCDARLHAIYVELAAEYYAATGTEVIVLAPAEGSCEETLAGLLAADQAPTLFCIHSEAMLEQWQHQLCDLTGSQAAQQLYGDAFALTREGKMLALAADVQGSGIIYNAAMLAKAGWSGDAIPDFASLSNTVSYIMANKSNLGYAFAAPDYADAALMQTLAGLYADSDQLRAFVDLYRKNCTAKTTTLNYFLKGTTVFYIGSTADYDTVSSIGSNNLGFLPAYGPGNSAVQCESSLFWAVNSDASKNDVAVTLDFLGWLVTAQDAGVPADRLGLFAPYRGASYAENVLERKLREYISGGNARLSCGETADVAAFTAALQAYIEAPSDESWAAVAQLFGA